MMRRTAGGLGGARLLPALLLAWGAALAAAQAASSGPATTIAALDLTRPFHTRGGWRVTVTQGPMIPGGDEAGNDAPGVITLCLARGGGGCDPVLEQKFDPAANTGIFDDLHELKRLGIVHARGDRALLLVQAAGVLSGDGDQGVLTQVLAYDRAGDRFRQVYRIVLGTNNNQDVRFIAAGPLRGDIVAAEPTQDAPYAYWVTVNAPAANGVYRPVLRYRSATRYGDGNPLAVIDAEMPGILRRLGRWRAGMPLPLPAGGCAEPRLLRGALWCGAPG